MTPERDLITLTERLAGVMVRDQRALHRQLEQLERDGRGRGYDTFVRRLEAAEERVAQRRASVPVLRYPEELPITASNLEIAAAIRDHQVVVVAGETGSGKTTQLPKICLQVGRGRQGMIGHTQPRRIAARSVAERLAEELGTPLGLQVGFSVRFTDRVSDATLVKVMTDGILLAEIQRDPLLNAYDTLIVDEAHERSLNIDFLLGYLKGLLPRRPDLKVIITSATIDTERFAQHFGNAPIIEVSGRTYPVEIRYEPIVEDDSDTGRDQTQAICDAVEELRREGPGDILVFLSGEREIRDTAEALRRDGSDDEILPLYARLSASEQHRVFAPHPGRRVVLATNVAETSLTVPGIRYVIDAGRARMSRYNHRTKVQRLPIEPISQASANQRAGRCGRIAPGICVRLYSEEDFASRPFYTDPEILRTNLASVILQMTAIGLGDVAAFGFLDPPDARNIRDGLALLEELGAFEDNDSGRRLSGTGRQLAQLPIDPRLGRMVLEAGRNDCLREVLVIAAALSIQDPREFPSDKRQAALDAHRRFLDPASDFLAYLRLWTYLTEQQKELSSNQFRRLCRAEFLNYLRVREWQDLYSQLRQVTRGIGLRLSAEAATPDAIHRSLLAGLLSHIGTRDQVRGDYLGTRNARFSLSPGSGLARKAPGWVMAAEMVETNRLWARTAARIQPEWAERLGAHLVKRSYSEPHWSAKAGAVLASERVTLYGLTLVPARQVNYSRIDPDLCRELFIRHALVEGDWQTRHHFFHHNLDVVDEARSLASRARRLDLGGDEETLFNFYDERVGAEVISARHFDRWWQQAQVREPDLLTLSLDDLLGPLEGGGLDPDAYPTTWRQGSLALEVTYEFSPGTDTDGVSVHVPLSVLNQVDDVGFDWQIPGLRLELVTELIRSLPKPIRRDFLPAPHFARRVLEQADPADGPLLDVLERRLPPLSGTPIPPGSWQPSQVPDRLKITFVVEDQKGRQLATSKSLTALKRRLQSQVRATMARTAPALEADRATTWSFGPIPRTVTRTWAGQTLKGYPAIIDGGDHVAVRVLDSAAEQDRAMWAGTRRLLSLSVASPVGQLQRTLPTAAKLALAYAPHGSLAAVVEDCQHAVLDDLLTEAGGPVWDEPSFEALRARVQTGLAERLSPTVRQTATVLEAARRLERRLDRLAAPAFDAARQDVENQLARLVHPGFVSTTGTSRLPDLVRYLQAAERRLDKLPVEVGRDRQRMNQVAGLQARYERLLAGQPSAELEAVRWMIEELRVSLFAQVLGTAYPVSEVRVSQALERLGG